MHELETAIRSGSKGKRAETLRRVTELFLSGADRFSDEQVELFDDVLMRLIDGIETKALIELGRSLAPVDTAPPVVIRRLARDNEIAVAAPVLAASNRLDVADLIEIARTKGQQHLIAISIRKHLEEALTSVLISSGNGLVLYNLARNSKAFFSEGGFATIVDRAEKDDLLTEELGRRSDIPPHLLERLLVRATRVVQERLLKSARPEARPEIRRVLVKISREIGVATTFRNYDAAQALVASRQETAKIAEADVLEFANAGKYEELVVALSVLCSVSLDVIDRLMDSERFDAMFIPCKAGGLGWNTTRAVIKLHARNQLVSSASYDEARGEFNKLTKATADRVLRFWQARLAASTRDASHTEVGPAGIPEGYILKR